MPLWKRLLYISWCHIVYVFSLFPFFFHLGNLKTVIFLLLPCLLNWTTGKLRFLELERVQFFIMHTNYALVRQEKAFGFWSAPIAVRRETIEEQVTIAVLSAVMWQQEEVAKFWFPHLEFKPGTLNAYIYIDRSTCKRRSVNFRENFALTFFSDTDLEQPVLGDTSMDAVIKFTNQSQGRDRIFR